MEEAILNNQSITIFPNPAFQHAELNFELLKPATISYSLSDITGRIVFESTPQKSAEGKQKIIINKNFNIGLYFIKLKINGQEFVKKIIFEN